MLDIGDLDTLVGESLSFYMLYSVFVATPIQIIIYMLYVLIYDFNSFDSFPSFVTL